MSDLQQQLRTLESARKFFIGIDSDGCAFDTMEIKHKECFCPQTIKYFGLQSVSRYAREAFEFVNLYSRERGKNRFPALISFLDVLRRRKEVKARRIDVPMLPSLRQWIGQETRLGNPALQALAEETNDPELKNVLEWSKAINAAIADMVRGVPPFPWVRESLQKVHAWADIVVVSQTPGDALKREWEEHRIHQYARMICGQEYGTKTEHIRFAAHGKYPNHKILMIGDALGDMKAARENDALFYPIIPGNEDASWKRFYKEGMKRFLNGAFAGVYQKKLIKELEKALPKKPHWR